MKILHITHTDIRFDNRIIKEIEALADVKDYTVKGIGMANNEGAAENSLNHINAEILTLSIRSKKIKYIPYFFRHTLVFFELLTKIIFISRKFDPDIIHCHDTLVLPIGWLIKLSRSKRKLVYDAHELESNKNSQSRLLSYVTLIIEKFCWHQIDFLITVSPSIQQWYNDSLGVKQGQIILNSPSLQTISNSQKTRREVYPLGYFQKKYSIKTESLVYIYVGALTRGRCIELMLKAFASGNISSHIVFVGFGPLKKMIVEMSNKHDNIHYHESVPHDLVVELIKNADIGMCLIENISLSDYFSLPNKLFEYSFSGIPILGSNFPDIKLLIEKHNLGFYCDVTYNSIIEIIKKTEANPPQKRVDHDLQMLSWEHQAHRLKHAYKTELTIS